MGKWFTRELSNLIHNRHWYDKARKVRKQIYDDLLDFGFKGRRFTSGSLGRKTQLPESDIDIFLEVDTSPPKIKEKIRKEFQRKYPKNYTRNQPHTVGIVFNDVKIEIIPAFIENSVYLIPEKDGTIETDPCKVKDEVKQMNRKTGGVFSRYVRSLKYWKKQNELPLPSFYLELLSLEEFKANNGYKVNCNDFMKFFEQISQNNFSVNKYPPYFTGKIQFANETEQKRFTSIVNKSKAIATKESVTDTDLKEFFNVF